MSFDEALVIYDQSYEGTQSNSAHFQRYMRHTAAQWVQYLGADTQKILEVGCGQGEFLEALTPLTNAQLVGYDPAYRGDAVGNMTVFPHNLPVQASEKYEAVINRMTLEHIADPFMFLQSMAGWVADRGCLITHVPNAARMIAGSLYCDLIYEHVNYFNAFALVRLLERVGFAENQFALSYGGQHLTVFSRRAVQPAKADPPRPTLHDFSGVAAQFSQHWGDRIAAFRAQGAAVYLWGAGSRATTFLNSIPDPSIVAGVIDINPRRAGTFVQGTGCETFLPDSLRNHDQLKIIPMNPIYKDEISATLKEVCADAMLEF